jgi:hypothetical protein
MLGQIIIYSSKNGNLGFPEIVSGLCNYSKELLALLQQ